MIDFFEFSNEMLCLADHRGYFTRVNQAWTKTLGWSVEELTCRPYFDFVHPDDLEATIREATLLQNRSYESVCFENRYRCPDGSYRWIAWNATLEPGSNRVVAAARDVTEQKLQAEALRESEARFRHLATHAPVGIFQADLAGKNLFVNERWCEMAGISAEQALGDGWKTTIHPDDQTRIFEEWGEAIRSGEQYQGEGRFVKPDGEVAWIQIAASVLRDAGGLPKNYIGTVVDITERQLAMAALEAEQNLLRQSIALQDRERQLLAYDIHDGMIQYVTGALMHLDSYRASLGNHPDAELIEPALKALRQTIAEGRRLMKGIRPNVLDEGGVIAAIADLVFENTTADTEIEFVSPTNGLGRLTPECEAAIYRMAQEALTNALKHSHSPKVRITLEHDEQRIRLSVRDWGIGTDLKQPSRGVHGLRGIKERVRLLNGIFKLESSPGDGTEIEIELPLRNL